MSATDPAAPAMPGEVALRDTNDLAQPPVYYSVDANKLALIQSQIAPGCSPAEISHFLELCAHYGLDAFAKEAWCAKNPKNGKVLIIVGRDGLRKIAQRNGLHVDGDVVRANDEFTICRTPDGNRTVTHSYGNPAKRGEIIGAWAECRMGGPLGRPMGYFYAPLEEYRPKGASDYSPWSKQVGVMILAAAERQAIRQATPLSGLLAVGEDETIAENTAPALGSGVGDGQPQGLVLGEDIEAVIARAERLGHHGFADRAVVEIEVADEHGNVIAAKAAKWVALATAQLDAMPQDAEVVDGESDPLAEAMVADHEMARARETGSPSRPYAQKRHESRAPARTPDPTPEAGNAPQAPPAAVEASESPEVTDPERIAALRRRGEELLNDAEALRDAGDPRADEVFEEFERVCAEVEAGTNADQGALPL